MKGDDEGYHNTTIPTLTFNLHLQTADYQLKLIHKTFHPWKLGKSLEPLHFKRAEQFLILANLFYLLIYPFQTTRYPDQKRTFRENIIAPASWNIPTQIWRGEAFIAA